MEGEIEVDGRRLTVALGFRRVDGILAVAGEGDVQMFLECDGVEPTPLVPTDHLLLRGGERLTKGRAATTDAPSPSKPIRPTLNGQTIDLDAAKATGRAIKANDREFPTGRLFVETVDDADVEIRDDITVVMREADTYFVVPPSAGDGNAIDLEECGKHGRRPPRGHTYRVRVDGAKFTMESGTTTRAELLALVGKNAQDWSLNQKLRGGRRLRIDEDDVIDLCKPGMERFETVRHQAQQGHG